MRNALILITLLAAFALIAGCGGGSTTGIAQLGPTYTTVTGVVSKGVIRGGTVNIYSPAPSGDITGKILLTSVTTNDQGGYSASLGSYKGIVLIEASGTYTDEATGTQLSIPEGAPLRSVAVIATAGEAKVMAVSPLTELAARKALSGTILTESSVAAANALLSNLFQFDIVATLPVPPSLPSMTGATQAQRDYTIALAAISEMAASAGSLSQVLNTFSSDLAATGRFSAPTVSSFQTATTTFLADTLHNQTGVSAPSQAILSVGYYTGTLYLATQGTASAPITSIQLTLSLPAGVTLKKGLNGEPLVSVYGAANQAAAPGKNYIEPSTLMLAVISSPGFSVGEFATVTYIAQPGVVPAASAFTVTYSKVTGFDGSNDFEIPVTVVPVLH